MQVGVRRAGPRAPGQAGRLAIWQAAAANPMFARGPG